MKRMLLCLMVLSCMISPIFGQDDLIKVHTIESNVYSIAVSPFDDTVIFCGADNSIYKSEQALGGFVKRFTVTADSGGVNHVVASPYAFGNVYCLSDGGLYLSRDSGESFARIFSLQDEDGNSVSLLRLLVLDQMLLLGTQRGLYQASRELLNFTRVTGVPKDAAVFDIKKNPLSHELIVATSRGIYVGDLSSCVFQKTFVTLALEKEEEEEQGKVIGHTVPQCIYINAARPYLIYVGTSSGLLVSQDSGKTWTKAHISGLDSLHIRRISPCDEDVSLVYLATDKGVFKSALQKRSLEQACGNLSSQDIRDVVFVKSRKTLYAATSHGLFISSHNDGGSLKTKINEEAACIEPTYLEIQEAALYYNNVHPETTKQWSRRLKLRALFPDVDLDYNKTIYGSSSGKFAVGPRDWSVGFSWDLGDFIWNSYEDDIDTRARLNTQTRLDILDEVRRLYFERKRTKAELLSLDLRQEDQEKKRLYLEELTAALDGYTGGYLSHVIGSARDK